MYSDTERGRVEGCQGQVRGRGGGGRGTGLNWYVYLDSDTEGGGPQSGQGGPGQLLGGGQGCAVAAAGAAGEAVELLRVGAHQPAARRLHGVGEEMGEWWVVKREWMVGFDGCKRKKRCWKLGSEKGSVGRASVVGGGWMITVGVWGFVGSERSEFCG